MVAVGRAAADFARQRFPDRALHVAASAAALPKLMAAVDAVTVTYAAPWRDLTVGVSRALAEWARADRARGCGLVPSDGGSGAAGGALRREPAAPRTVLLVHAGPETHAALATSEGRCDLPLAAALDAAVGAPPLAGLAITGHGNEVTIPFGGSWLTAESRLSPPGDTVAPSRVSARAVLLNSCSALRLGDSVVPKRYSVAGVLHSQGALVMGPYRNAQVSPAAGVAFAEALHAGFAPGAIVNELNARAAEFGDMEPLFQLLGDPVGGLLPPADQVPSATRANPKADLSALCGELAWADRLCLTLARWQARPARLAAAHEAVLEVARPVYIANRVAELEVVSSEEVAELAAVASARLDRLRTELLHTVQSTLDTRWLDAVYGPTSSRELAGAGACGRCGEGCIRWRYAMPGDHPLAVERVECDRCGSVSDRVGGRVGVAPLRLALDGRRVTVTLPRLDNGERGRVFVRRAGGGPAHEWPASGGRVAFDVAASSLAGRVKVAAVTIGPSALVVRYGTVFVPID